VWEFGSVTRGVSPIRKGTILTEYVPGSLYGPTDGLGFESKWQGGYLEAHLLSNLGKKRQNNEDSCLMCASENPNIRELRGLLFSVADGMGGANAGEHASSTALKVLSDAYINSPYDRIPDALIESMNQANGRVYEEALTNPEYSGMGTTVSVLAILGDWAYVAQVGDSRVYLLQEHRGIQQVTHDHSLVAEQVREGLISEEEAENHSLKNLITRAVGIKDAVQTDLFSLQIKHGDTFLICSDGLCNMVSDEDISAELCLRDLGQATNNLIQRALDGGGSDNITAVTVRVAGVPPKTALHPGAELINVRKKGFWGKLWDLFG
jgi:serine/threonine protein phosphatase PrpC